jgi:hypothetical protein
MVLLRVSEDSETGSRLSMLEVDVTSLAVRQAVVIELTAPCQAVHSHREDTTSASTGVGCAQVSLGVARERPRLASQVGCGARISSSGTAEFVGTRTKESTCRGHPLP